MTADPNKPVTTEPALTIEGGDEPPAAVSPVVDVDAIAEAVIGKLVKAAEAQPAPAAQPKFERPDTSSYDEMVKVVNAGDRTHPLFGTYEVQLALLRRQGEEDEWASLKCGVDHPARELFRSDPGRYAGQPRFAYQEWWIQASQKQQAEEKVKQDKEAKDREARERVRDSAPGMPSRSVGGSTRSGSLKMTHAEFNRRVETEPDLDDKYDQGLIVFTD